MADSNLNIRITSDSSQAKRDISGFKSSFTELKSQIDLAVMGFQLIRDAAVKAFEFAKQGAELERTRGQLENLAVSIGTTADALINRIGEATSGMLSNSETIGLATEIISLGLAGTEDEAVRLATVMGEMGWSVQQTVLTMANNSTMRLDSLGLSVQDVTTKAKALEEQGFDADKAFDLAVIEAAEEKIRLVGSAAETAAGQYKIFEANIKNVNDNLKILAADALTPVVSGANEYFEAQVILNEAVRKGVITSEDLNAILIQLKFSTDDFKNSIEDVTEELDWFNLEAERERDRLLEVGAAARLANLPVYDFAINTELAGSAAIYAEQAMASAPESYRGVGRAAGDAVEPLTNFADALDEAAKGRPSAFESLIADIKWFMAGGAEVAQFMADFEASLAAGLTPDDAALQAATTGLVGSLLAGIEAGQTDFEAAKQTLMDTLGIDEADAEDMLSEFATAADAIAEAERELEYAIILDPNSERILANLMALLGIEGHTLNLNITGAAGGSFGGVHIGDTGSRTLAHSGADFIVPPGFPNDSFPMRVESGEHVQVTPANQVGLGVGGAPVIVLLDGEQIAARVLSSAGSQFRQTRANGGGYVGR